MVFTRNVPMKKKGEIVRSLGVKEAINTGVYLGIPSFWGKTRYEAMSYVRDKVVKKLSNWKQQTLSQGGKEVLIKAVASSVPTYMMACFKLPKKICGEMNSAVANFWWGRKSRRAEYIGKVG